MDNGLDTYESDKEQEEAAKEGDLEVAIQASRPSGSLAPSVEASEPASSAEALTRVPSSAGVPYADLPSNRFQHAPDHAAARAFPGHVDSLTQQQKADLTWHVRACLSRATK